MRFAETDHATVAYRIDGTGPALVLVHGTGGNSETNWSGIVDRLAEHFTVIRPDYSGSGLTRDDGRPLKVEDMARQVLAAVNAEEIERFDLLGFSLGAGIAVELAATTPDRVRSLILLAGFAALDARLALQFTLWRHLIDTDRRALAQLILLTGFRADYLASLGDDALSAAVEDTLTGSDWDGMRRQVELDLSIDVSRRLPQLTMPTLVLGCADDQMVPNEHSRHLATEIAGAGYAELPSGHLAPMETPDALAAAIEEFLGRRSVR